MKTIYALLILMLVCFFGIPSALADAPVSRDLPPGLQIPDAARPGPTFDVDKATQAYIDLLSPEQRAQSDAYFEGGYWLQLFGLFYGLVVVAVLLWGRISQRMRDIAERVTARPWLYTWIYLLLFVLAFFVLNLPWSIYTDYVREHQFGLATQTFGGWFGDQLKALLVSIVVLPLVLVAVYAAIRRTGARWWIWASGIAFVFALFAMMFAPVYVEPLFNDYKPLREGAAHDAVYSLALANQIPTDHVVEFDASRQTTRISANVAGFLGTTRVALNDNLLNKTSLPEIKAVLGHEMGHYVLNHGMRGVIYLTIIFVFAFWFTHRLLDAALARWGVRLGLRNRADPAALPLVFAIISIFSFFITPVSNSVGRQIEAEADAFGLNAAREPNGFAMAAMRLSTYRKIHPGPLEEIIFYDHPSGYARVHGSMIWLKENQDNATARAALPVTVPAE
jgi:STE24 endopeptidase